LIRFIGWGRRSG